MNLKKYFIYTPEEHKNKFLVSEDIYKRKNNKNSYIENEILNKKSFPYVTGMVSTDIKENLEFIKSAFSVPKNFDFIIRKITIKTKSKETDAFLIFYDGLVNKNYINRDILKPLMVETDEVLPKDKDSLTDMIYNRMITQAPISKVSEFKKIISLIEFGCCAVFVDGADSAFVSDVKGWEKRGVEKPITEATLSGPQEGFTETVMSNIGMIRKILKDLNVVSEIISVGEKSKTPCALMYINGVTNHSLVKEIKRRLCGISTDYVFSSSDIEMYIEDSSAFLLPQILKTERPDRAAAMLADGKAIIIVQGSPFVLVLPGSFSDLIEAAEDNYVRVIEANFMRMVRLIGIWLSLFLPASFASAVLYHHETVPTDLLFAIGATREQMPFPIIAELVIMIIAFELIKEASIRIPGPIGSTLGIVGGLILGQAAVSAGIASPLLIIIVSIAGLGSFAAPSLSLSRSLSVLQLIFVFFAAIGGFLGMASGVFLGIMFLVSQKSFGVPYFSAVFTQKGADTKKTAFINPIWKRENRPEKLKPQKKEKQPHISLKWKNKK